jgi:cyclic pyranopterin phosphate synthase
MTTNAITLERLAKRLAEAGLDSVNVSLDAADADRFWEITGTDTFDQVIRGITAARQYIGQVKINTVVMNGVNDHILPALVDLADSIGADIRFIEFMPSQNGLRPALHMPVQEIMTKLPYQLTPLPRNENAAAKYHSASGKSIRVGFISPVSHPFCSDCDRIRLTADGRLYGCLFSHGSLDLFQATTQPDYSVHEIRGTIRALKTGIQSVSDRFEISNLPSFSRIGG